MEETVFEHLRKGTFKKKQLDKFIGGRPVNTIHKVVVLQAYCASN